MARLLVNKGASLDHVDGSGRTVMHKLRCFRPEVVEKWEHDVALPFVKYLISMSFEDLDTPDFYQGTPLSQMATMGASNVWSTLLRYGAGTRETRKTFDSKMLYYAASGGNISIVKCVLESDSPINLNTFGSSIPLHAAAAEGHAAVVELLLDKGAAVDAKDYAGTTALHKACHIHCIGVIKLLLERGADVNCTNYRGFTPLRYSGSAAELASSCYGHPFFSSASSKRLKAFQEVSSCLLQYGADPHVLEWKKFGPFPGTGYLCTPTEAAKLACGNDVFDSYVRILAENDTEIVVDTDRDVFWDAKEEITGEGYGCSYESEMRWREEEEKWMEMDPWYYTC